MREKTFFAQVSLPQPLMDHTNEFAHLWKYDYYASDWEWYEEEETLTEDELASQLYGVDNQYGR